MRYLARKRVEDAGGGVLAFSHARTGLKFGLQALELGDGDALLVPSFICDALFHPLDRLGIRSVFYAVDRELNPDWEALPWLLDPSIKGIVMVHYFGVPQDIPRFRAFCDAHHLRLIEDNAHGHGATVDGKPLGTWGDVGISSPRKNYPLINGGLLYLQNTKALHVESLPLEPGLPAISIAASLAKSVFQSAPAGLINLFRRQPEYACAEAFREPEPGDWAMDAASRGALEKHDLTNARRIRQDVYRLWHGWANAQDLEPVFPGLPRGAMPLVFPAWTKSHAESRQWFDWGFRHRIDVHSWPTLPDEVLRRNGTALDQWKRLLCFPIHQEMNPDRLREYLRRLAPLRAGALV